MTQKMWVHKEGIWWEVGCQRCGRLVGEDTSWWYAMQCAFWHILQHQKGCP